MSSKKRKGAKAPTTKVNKFDTPENKQFMARLSSTPQSPAPALLAGLGGSFTSDGSFDERPQIDLQPREPNWGRPVDGYQLHYRPQPYNERPMLPEGIPCFLTWHPAFRGWTGVNVAHEKKRAVRREQHAERAAKKKAVKDLEAQVEELSLVEEETDEVTEQAEQDRQSTEAQQPNPLDTDDVDSIGRGRPVKRRKPVSFNDEVIFS